MDSPVPNRAPMHRGKNHGTAVFERLIGLERVQSQIWEMLENLVAKLGHTDISPQHALMLHALQHMDRLPAERLQRMGYLHGPKPTAKAAKLEQAGYITIEMHAADRRQRVLRLTDKGRDFAEGMDKILSDIGQKLSVENISFSQLDTVYKALRSIQHAVEQTQIMHASYGPGVSARDQ